MGEPAKGRARDPAAAAESFDSPLLARSASRSLHRVGAGIRSVLSCRTGEARYQTCSAGRGGESFILFVRRSGARGRGATSPLQDHLRKSVSRCASNICGGHYRPVRGALGVADGLQVPVQRPAGGQCIFPAQTEIRARVESMARFYGMLGGVTYAEPFVQKEVGLVDDIVAIPVKSI